MKNQTQGRIYLILVRIFRYVPNLKLNDPLEEGDIFSSNNFELAMPLTKSNETKSGSSNTEEFEKIYIFNINNTLLDNDTQIGAAPPSILEIESNQNSNAFLSISNVTRLIADAGNDRTVSEVHQWYSMEVTVRVIRV